MACGKHLTFNNDNQKVTNKHVVNKVTLLIK